MQRKYLNFTTYLLILTLCFATLTVMYTPNVAAKSNKNDFLLKVTPTDRSINVGEQAKFTVTVESISSSNSWKHLGKVHLTLLGVPWDALGVFSQSTGIPTFESKLKILTTQDVEPGLYEITIIALSKKGRETATIALLINGESTEKSFTSTKTTSTQTTSTTTQTESPSEPEQLEVTFSTDKLSYNGGEPVSILGVVKDSSQNSVQDASISIQVDDPLGSAAHIYQTTTDSYGSFNDTFVLDDNALHGTYSVFVTAAYQGDQSQAHSTFVVGESNTPSVSIVSLIITANGQQDTIEPGMEVLAAIQVSNLGSELENGMVWIEIDDSRDVPVYLTLLKTTIRNNDTLEVEFHFFLRQDAVGGVYTAYAYVSNGLISEGGVFLDMEQEMFVVETSSPPATTTTSDLVTTSMTNSTATTNSTSTETITTTTTTSATEP